MIVQQIEGGAKNLTYWVRGVVRPESTEVLFDINELPASPNGHRVHSLILGGVIWWVQEKAGVALCIGDPKSNLMVKEENVLLMLESRGGTRFDVPVPLPRLGDGWNGKISLVPFAGFDSPKWVGLILDFDRLHGK